MSLSAALASLQSAQTASLADLSLFDFVPRVTPAFAPPRHLAPLVDLLDAVEREPVRACVSVPPRHSKTETVLHGIARLLARHPDWTVAYVSYAADIARSKSRQLRDYAQRAGVTLRSDSAALHEWRTPQGGGLLATGIGGPLTGHGVRLLVVDDPYKNRQDADSPTVRASTLAWFTSTAMTRVEPGGSALIVHTRWHRDDLIGSLERDEEVDWEVVNLPAIDSERRALWPARWGLDALEQRRREVGEHDWQSLFQGHPTARKGRVYEAFSRTTHVVPHTRLEQLYRREGRWAFRRILVGVDWGYTHPGAMVVVGVTGAGQLVVLHEEHHQHMLVAERTSPQREGWLSVAKRLRAEFAPERFVADPSEPGFILQLRQALAGHPVVENARNDVSEGIRRAQVAMALRPDGAPGLLVSDRCTALIDELETYSYRATAGGVSETPQETHDDACDALRYAVMAA